MRNTTIKDSIYKKLIYLFIYLLTFWSRFYWSRNYPRNQVRIKDILILRPVPSTEFRGGSRGASHFAWRCNIFKILPGGVETHSKTPIKHVFQNCCFLVRILKMDSPEGRPPRRKGLFRKSQDSENEFPEGETPETKKTYISIY